MPNRLHRFSTILAVAMCSPILATGCSGDSVITQGTEPGCSPCTAQLTVQPNAVTLAVGTTVQLTAAARNLSGAGVPSYQWSTNNAQVAAVSSTGFVRALSAGSAVITVAAAGRTAIASVIARP